MPLNITLDINGRVIHEMRVRNMGYPTATEHQWGSGVRRYVVTLDGTPIGEVLHNRPDGAAALAAKALRMVPIDHMGQE